MATISQELSNPKNRPWIIGAGALTAGVLGYAWWTRGQSEAAAAQSALAQIPGPVEEPTDTPGFDIIGGTTTAQPATNAEWTQLAVERLVNQGYEGLAVYSALGKFLGRQPLTTAEADIVRAALAAAGQPPVTGGSPFSVIGITPPAAVGLTTPILTSTLPVFRNGAWEYTIAWAPVPGATRYWFQHVGGSSGYLTTTKTNVIRAAPGRTDTWKFAAVNAANVKGPEATFAKSFPPAAAKPPPAPASVGLLPGPAGRNAARHGVAFPPAPGATKYRYRGHNGRQATAWATAYPAPRGNYPTWKYPRGQRFFAQVQSGNAAGWGGVRNSNTVAMR